MVKRAIITFLLLAAVAAGVMAGHGSYKDRFDKELTRGDGLLTGDEKEVVWYNLDAVYDNDADDANTVSIRASGELAYTYYMRWPVDWGEPNSVLMTPGVQNAQLVWGEIDANLVDVNATDPNVVTIRLPVLTPGSRIFVDANGFPLYEDNDNAYFDDTNDFAGFALGYIASGTRPNNYIQVYKLLNFDPTLFNTSVGWSYTDSLTGPNNVRLGYHAGKGMTSGTRVAYGGRGSGEFANENTDNAFWGFQTGQNITGTPGGGTWREWVVGRGASGMETWTYEYVFDDEAVDPPYNQTYHVHQDTAGFIYAGSGKDGSNVAKPYKFNADLTQVAGWPAYGTWPTGGGSMVVHSVRPTNDAQNVYVVTLNGSNVQITKLTASTGALVWREEWSGVTPYDLGVLANDDVVAGNYNSVPPDRFPAILSATDGSVVLQYTAQGANPAHYRILVVEELGQWFSVGTASIYVGLCQGFLDDSDSGWDFDPFAGSGTARGIVYKNGYLYVGTDRSTYSGNLTSMFKLDPSDGSVVDSWDLGFAPQDIAINYLGQFVVVTQSGDPMWRIYDDDFNLLASHNRNSATAWRIEQIPDPILYGGAEPSRGHRNAAIGSEALRGASGADPNEASAGGYKSIYSVGSDSDHPTGWGAWSLYNLSTGDRDIGIGPYSGWPITTEDDYIVFDSRKRDTVADMNSMSIIVGQTADDPNDQWLNINAGTVSMPLGSVDVNDLTVAGALEAKTGRSSTLVVAANNSSDTSKAQADYVCDGTADQVEINAAIQALPTLPLTNDAKPSGKVILLEGIYSINAPIDMVTDNDGITLEGQGSFATIIELAASSNCNMIEVVPTEKSYGVRIRSLMLVGNKSLQSSGHGIYIYRDGVKTPADIYMEDIFVATAKEDGLNTNYTWGYRIFNSLFEYCGGDGIHITGGSQSYFANVFCAGNTGDGFDINTGYSTMVNCVASTNGGRGFDLGFENSTVSNLVAYDNTGVGIWLTVDCSLASMVSCYSDNNIGIRGQDIVLSGNVVDGELRVHSQADNITIDVSNKATTFVIDSDTARGIDYYGEQTKTGVCNLVPSGITNLDSSGGAVTATLPDGFRVGQIKIIVMTDATNPSTVSVTSHETSDPEVGTFNAVDETWVLTWTGTEWATIIGNCATLGFDSAVFQPEADSTTFFQILDADGGTPIMNVDSTNEVTQFGDGGTTDYVELEADGTVEFNGAATVWNDINVGAVMLSLPAASVPDEDEFVDEAGADTGISTWAYAIGEKSSGTLQLEHFYKEGSDVYFHIHWEGITAPGGGTDNVKWQLTYTVAQDGATLDAPTIITKEEAFTTQYNFHTHDFAAITGTNFNIGDQFLFTIERIAASADDYAGDCLLSTVGLHVECDTVGSRTTTAK